MWVDAKRCGFITENVLATGLYSPYFFYRGSATASFGHVNRWPGARTGQSK